MRMIKEVNGRHVCEYAPKEIIPPGHYIPYTAREIAECTALDTNRLTPSRHNYNNTYDFTVWVVWWDLMEAARPEWGEVAP